MCPSRGWSTARLERRSCSLQQPGFRGNDAWRHFDSPNQQFRVFSTVILQFGLNSHCTWGFRNLAHLKRSLSDQKHLGSDQSWLLSISRISCLVSGKSEVEWRSSAEAWAGNKRRRLWHEENKQKRTEHKKKEVLAFSERWWYVSWFCRQKPCASRVKWPPAVVFIDVDDSQPTATRVKTNFPSPCGFLPLKL